MVFEKRPINNHKRIFSNHEIHKLDGMSFKKSGIKQSRPIRRPLVKGPNKFKRGLVIAALLIAGVFIIRGTIQVFTLASDFSPKEIILSIFSSKVKTDRMGHTNFLLLGTGDPEHDGGNLADTIIVASLDHEDGVVSMISIPRDLYIEFPVIGGSRINRMFALAKLEFEESDAKALEFSKSQISKALDIPIHYVAKINFSGFEDVVNALGGIEIDVKETLDDPFYPLDETELFEPLLIPAGKQILDGETALKYVRSRKTTSDFDRSYRQQQMVSALKDTVLSAGLVTNPSKMKNIYESIIDNFETDLSWSEMVYIVKLAEDINSNDILMHVINDDPYTEGGFLYTPEREMYNGAYVLIPFTNDFSEIHKFVKLAFYNHEVHSEKIPIQILNGAGTANLAGDALLYLERYGFNIIRYGNAFEEDQQDTEIYLLFDQENETLEFLPRYVEGEITELPEQYFPENFNTDAGIIVLLGEDFATFREKKEELFYLNPFDSTFFGRIPAELPDDKEITDDEEITYEDEETEPETT